MKNYDYEKDLNDLIKENNNSSDPLPVDAMNVVLNEFKARMLAKIAASLESIAESMEK